MLAIAAGIGLVTASVLAFSAAFISDGDADEANRVTLRVKGATQINAADAEGRLFIDMLPNIDPTDEEMVRQLGQVLSLYGREDLVAAAGGANGPATTCDAADVSMTFDDIVHLARHTQIVIVSEDHVESRHRAFTGKLAGALREEGYDYFAAEAFTNFPKSSQELAAKRADANPEESYFRLSEGTYIQEAQFGRLGRLVKTLGYTLVPYEHLRPADEPHPKNLADRINQRDRIQAANLVEAVFAANPDAKILVHVGASHAKEVAVEKENGDRIEWLAYRLKKETEIDPLTIAQHRCVTGGSDPALLTGSGGPTAGFDVLVSHPVTEFVSGRPAWRSGSGDIAVTIPPELLDGNTGWRIIEAYHEDEPDDAVPMDTVAVWGDEDVSLMLPPGEYDLRVIELPGTD